MAHPREKQMAYPKHDAYRSGCKVGWYYYLKREDADQASKAAIHNAEIDAALGYDFGYQCPGTIRWSEQRQMWEVCVP